MKKIAAIFTLILVISFEANAQSLTPQVIASTGGFASNSNGSLSYTVGEMTMVQTFSANGNILTQGFQQPSDSTIGLGLLDIASDNYIQFIVYPNPAISQLWFGFMSAEPGNISIVVYDLLGQKINEPYSGVCNVGKTMQQMNVSELASGMYVMESRFISAKSGKEYTNTKRVEVVR
jgi:hypothetical protein